MSAVSHSGHVCFVAQQMYLLRHKAENVCCVTQSALSAVSHSRRVRGVTQQQTCLPCHTADMSAVKHSRHVCYVTLLCGTADMSSVSQSKRV